MGETKDAQAENAAAAVGHEAEGENEWGRAAEAKGSCGGYVYSDKVQGFREGAARRVAAPGEFRAQTQVYGLWLKPDWENATE